MNHFNTILCQFGPNRKFLTNEVHDIFLIASIRHTHDAARVGELIASIRHTHDAARVGELIASIRHTHDAARVGELIASIRHTHDTACVVSFVKQNSPFENFAFTFCNLQ